MYLRPEELFLSNLDAIDRAARFVARRGGLSPEDADDLAAHVKLVLIENDYAVLQGFEGRCSLGTYVASIAHRLLCNERMHVGGRWRPSAESKRAGEAAVLLETLVVRDRKPIDEALPLVRKIDPAMTRASASALLARLPKRAQRAQLVPFDDQLHEQEVGAETVEERTLAHERAAAAETTNAVVRQALDTLSADDRVLLRLRFGNGMRVSAIARAWQCEQQILYRRIETMVRRLRQQLVGAGIDPGTAAQLIGAEDGGLEFGWADDEKPAARQTISMKRSGSSEETVP
jgi:RNA polymerase sigma factor (sigma-70 family)